MKSFTGRLPKGFIKTLEWLEKNFGKGEFMVCGSTGLLMNKVIKRRPNDLDIITIQDWYSPGPKGFGRKPINLWDTRQAGQSDTFYVGKTKVKCFKLLSPYGVYVDVMFRKGKLDYTEFSIKSLAIKVQNISGAVEAKKKYLEIVKSRSSSRPINPKSVKKHSEDVQSYYNDDIPF